MIPKKLQDILRRQHYALAGKHSAVQICRWTKKALLDEGYCYKQKFYGISSHKCCQMSPAVAWCYNRCLHCWRAIEFTLGGRIAEKDADKPEKIIDESIKAQRTLLSGFKGNAKVNKKKLQEAQEPKHFAISLAGEPLTYPCIGELVELLRKRGKTTFIVTSGLLPEKLEELNKKNQLPTQLYVSLNAPNKQIYDRITQSKMKDAWQRFNKTLSLLPSIETRKVLRMTLVRDLNIIEPVNYAKLIKKAKPDFVEVKAFMSVGFARQRLAYERMPLHPEIVEFTKNLAKLTNLKILDEKKESRVVLLGKSRENLKIKNP
jgi:tRNA wybutosine-synthesizing protein 1